MMRGFTLIEVLIATLIAAILGGLLMSTYYQVNRSAQSMDNLITTHERLVLIAHQLERDISGAFIPRTFGKKEEKPAEPTQGEQLTSESSEEKSEQDTQPQGETKQQKIKHIFFSSNKDKQLDSLTFITNNPLQVYWSARAGQAKPRIARVVYRLVPEKENPRQKNRAVSYSLMRQESGNLDFNAFKAQEGERAIRAFEVANGIKDFKVRFGALVGEDAELKEFDVWNMENGKEQQDEKEKEQRRKVPHEVYITITLWDAQKKRSSTREFTIPIIPDMSEPEQPQEKKIALPLHTTQRLIEGAQDALANFKKQNQGAAQ